VTRPTSYRLFSAVAAFLLGMVVLHCREASADINSFNWGIVEPRLRCRVFDSAAREKVTAALECLKSDPVLRAMVEHLEADPLPTVVCPDGTSIYQSSENGDPNKGEGSRIHWTPPPDGGCRDPANLAHPACARQEGRDKSGQEFDEGAYNNPTAALAHELWHTFEHRLGKKLHKLTDACSQVDLSEVTGVQAENVARQLPCASLNAKGSAGDPYDYRDNYKKPLCVCGNGILEPNRGEECDPGYPGKGKQVGTPAVDFFCPGRCGARGGASACRCPAECGNGIVNDGETCDPGNPASGIPASDSRCPGECPAAGTATACLCSCGNGHLDPDEACDASTTEGPQACAPDKCNAECACAGTRAYEFAGVVTGCHTGIIDECELDGLPILARVTLDTAAADTFPSEDVALYGFLGCDACALEIEVGGRTYLRSPPEYPLTNFELRIMTAGATRPSDSFTVLLQSMVFAGFCGDDQEREWLGVGIAGNLGLQSTEMPSTPFLLGASRQQMEFSLPDACILADVTSMRVLP
jgi:hypothetical protein